MSPLQASLIAVVLSFIGMTALAMAMDRHLVQLTPKRQITDAARHGLRGLGTLCLLGTLFVCVQAWSATVGVVAGLGFVSLGALLISVSMAVLPRALIWVAMGASAVLGAAVLISAVW